MTKEEIIENLWGTAISKNVDVSKSDIRGFVDFIITNYEPDLPSSLDGAAKEYNLNLIPFDQCDSRDIICAFKAGAEWQKEQMKKNAIELPVKIDAGGYPYIQITGIEFFDYDKDKPTKKEGDVVRILILNGND